MSKTIIISNRLPVRVEKEGDKLNYIPSEGGLATGLGSIYKEGDNIWIGWPGIYFENEKEEKAATAELQKESMRPVFLSQEDIELYYEGFSNSTIWPLFHYFAQYVEYNNKYWEAYIDVNRKFCETIVQYAEPDDVIWVHDYQLLLLPQMLRDKLPNASIGYFNHIPFPSFEMFRNIPQRKQLLKGVLGADMIGFHTYDDMRHFLSSVSRIVGIDHEMGHIKYQGRYVTVDSLPMGIDYDKFANAAISKETQREVKNFYSSVSTKQLVLSIDRLDYSKGIPQRLEAFDAFLEQYPEFHNEVSLILLVVPSRDTVDHYKKLKDEIELLVGRINGRYGKMNWTPIHYFYRSLPFHKLSALYTMSDVALVTPLRDGMNLVCKEFIASKLDKSGVLILSEMAGSAKELTESILVNPNDKSSMVNALYSALTMSPDEQESRNVDMQSKLRRYNIHNWVDNFMKGLDETIKRQKEHASKHINKSITKEIAKKFKSAKKRLLLLDYDGTLAFFHNNPLDAKPDKELKEIMAALTEDDRNDVVVISGRDRETLHNWLSEYNVEFVAEHGVWHKEKGKEWEQVPNLVDDWKEEIQHILELFVDRTPGSFIEYKDYSLVWHYRKAEQGLGDLRSRELISHLHYMTGNMDLHIMEGHKVIEIKNSGVNKGRGALRWVNKDEYDYIIALGDDYTDEDTFKVVPTDLGDTIRVGFVSTDAKYNIKSPREVRNLLKEFANITTNE